MKSLVDQAKDAFADACEACGTDPITEEQAILSIGREFLPAYALKVLDGKKLTQSESRSYWSWLSSQVLSAQLEHDQEYALGHEWHQEDL